MLTSRDVEEERDIDMIDVALSFPPGCRSVPHVPGLEVVTTWVVDQ